MQQNAVLCQILELCEFQRAVAILVIHFQNLNSIQPANVSFNTTQKVNLLP